MQRLGIIVAMKAEARPLGLRVDTDMVIEAPGVDVMLCISGIGARRARIAGQQLLAQGANALLSWGTAVALDAGLRPGQLLLPREVLNSDRESLRVSLQWQRLLANRLPERFETNNQAMIETREVLATPEDKHRLRARTGAIAADMESAALAGVARDAAVPFVVVRSVADTMQRIFPAWSNNIVDAYGRVRPIAGLLPLLTHPADWPEITRIARDFRAALATLSAVTKHLGLNGLKPTGAPP